MKGFRKLLILFAIFLIASAPLAAAAPAITTCHEQGAGKQNPTNIGGYDLAGPVVSGSVTVTDVGNTANRGKTVLTDLVEINKEVTPQGSGFQVDLTIEARPAKLSYNPPPTLDVIFVYDVTTSMLDPIERLENAQAAIKQSAEDIWAENPDSTITIIPYARDVFTPLPTGGLSFNDSNMYTAHYEPSLAYNRPNSSLTNTTYLALEAALLSLNGDIGTVFENDYLYYRVTKADVDSMPSQMNTFNDSIDAIPIGSDTNTHSGLMKAYEFLTVDSNFTQMDQENRVVILVTDGNAGRWITAGAVNSVGGYNRADVLEAHDQAKAMADKITDPSDGNAIMYALGLSVGNAYFSGSGGWEGYAQSISGRTEILPDWTTLPTVSSYIDVSKFIGVLPTSPDHYFNADSTDLIEDMMSQAVTSSTHYYAPVGNLIVNDEINSDLFTLVPGSIEISVDGGTFDPLSTAYPSSTEDSTSFSVNLEDNPITVPLTAQSKTEYVIRYEITPKPGVEGGHLHIGNDRESYVSYIAPEHHTSPAAAVYNHNVKDTHRVPFNTPVVKVGFYITKEVSADGGQTWHPHVTLPSGGGMVDYKITIGNLGSSPLYIDRVNDQIGGTNPILVYADKTNNNLLEAAGVIIGPLFNTTTPTKIENGSVVYEVTYRTAHTASGTYKNMVVIQGFGTDLDFDNPGGDLRDATATVTVERANNGGGGGNGGGNIVNPGNTAPAPNQPGEQPSANDDTPEEKKIDLPIEEIKEIYPVAAYFILIVLMAVSIYIWKRRNENHEE
jgi:hypothetical protein